MEENKNYLLQAETNHPLTGKPAQFTIQVLESNKGHYVIKDLKTNKIQKLPKFIAYHAYFIEEVR